MATCAFLLMSTDAPATEATANTAKATNDTMEMVGIGRWGGAQQFDAMRIGK
ncbi:hypothetical protein PF001_g26999 [Phytophthora fragariae]|uniref:Uncharacterized protein n=1 Tax=Phytophthora fragariae TaxID=53985 RepID=A0A6A3QUW6_9STRA|nr:hypothetical protein PF006_g26979 [Phytophthora fragariae]KAE9274577.1 hypothetical protein PF001_g26999 [Phytophthora fragariae]